jgi:hypothetical protein
LNFDIKQNEIEMHGKAQIYLVLFFDAIQSAYSCRQLNDKRGIVRLNFRFVSRLISYYGATLVASVNDYVTLFRIGFGFDRTKNPSAIICSVTRIYIHV